MVDYVSNSSAKKKTFISMVISMVILYMHGSVLVSLSGRTG